MNVHFASPLCHRHRGNLDVWKQIERNCFCAVAPDESRNTAAIGVDTESAAFVSGARGCDRRNGIRVKGANGLDKLHHAVEDSAE